MDQHAKSYARFKHLEKNGSASLSEDPSPSDFEEFLPWACKQFSLTCNVVVQKKSSDELKKRRKENQKLSSTSIPSVEVKSSEEMIPSLIKVTTMYDNQGNLVELVIGGKTKKPVRLLRILYLMLPFHTQLTTFTIEPPFDINTAHEVKKVIQYCNITDLTLDGCYILKESFCLFLEDEMNLTKLSLSRCYIDDKILEVLVRKLAYPSTASETLCILNLCSNKISDEGAKHIGTILRSNRQLTYLNLADNSITDDGARYIFGSLMEFEVNSVEWHDYRSRYVNYIKQKINLINKLNEENVVFPKKKPDPPKQVIKKKTSKLMEASSVEVHENRDEILATMALEIMGEFKDPFHKWRLDGENIFCEGNTTLQFLNLAYNKLSYRILRKICDVMIYQKEINNKPRGLVCLTLEGNLLPNTCREYTLLEVLMSDVLMSHRDSSATIKRGSGRSKSINKTSYSLIFN